MKGEPSLNAFWDAFLGKRTDYWFYDRYPQSFHYDRVIWPDFLSICAFLDLRRERVGFFFKVPYGTTFSSMKTSARAVEEIENLSYLIATLSNTQYENVIDDDGRRFLFFREYSGASPDAVLGRVCADIVAEVIEAWKGGLESVMSRIERGLDPEIAIDRFRSWATARIAAPTNTNEAIRDVVVAHRYAREQSLVHELKRLYQGRCQVCGSSPSDLFACDITEVHHLVPLSDGGPDTIQNMAVLCPNHHALIHKLEAKWDQDLLLFRGNGGARQIKINLDFHLRPTGDRDKSPKD